MVHLAQTMQTTLEQILLDQIHILQYKESIAIVKNKIWESSGNIRLRALSQKKAIFTKWLSLCICSTGETTNLWIFTKFTTNIYTGPIKMHKKRFWKNYCKQTPFLTKKNLFLIFYKNRPKILIKFGSEIGNSPYGSPTTWFSPISLRIVVWILNTNCLFYQNYKLRKLFYFLLWYPWLLFSITLGDTLSSFVSQHTRGHPYPRYD